MIFIIATNFRCERLLSAVRFFLSISTYCSFQMIDFIQESGVITAMVGMLNAPQGTKLYERMEKEGRILEGEFTGSNEMGTNFEPKMGISTLVSGYQRVVRAIYEPKNFYYRVKIFLENYHPKAHRNKVKGSGFGTLSAFFKSSFQLGVLSKGRIHYWKLLGWSLSKGMNAFASAVKFSIYGYHFRMCLDEK